MSYSIIKAIGKIRNGSPNLGQQKKEPTTYTCTKPGFTTVKTTKLKEARNLVKHQGYSCDPPIPTE